MDEVFKCGCCCCGLCGWEIDGKVVCWGDLREVFGVDGNDDEWVWGWWLILVIVCWCGDVDIWWLVFFCVYF